jgi:hypothetical protein
MLRTERNEDGGKTDGKFMLSMTFTAAKLVCVKVLLNDS